VSDGQVWVIVVATVEVPVGPFSLDANFRGMLATSEREASSRLECALARAHMAIRGRPRTIAFRADLESGIPTNPVPLNELPRKTEDVAGAKEGT
jgi:hypothetical protein